MDALRWKHPFATIVAGPTSCGKTVFVKKFLKHRNLMVDVVFDRILFYYAEWQDGYKSEEFLGEPDNRLKIEFREGLPKNEDYSNDLEAKKLIIIDDLMRESSNNVVVDLFTKGSHHKNISIIFITQNIFHRGAHSRDISLNASYIVLFKNPRDKAQIQHLARQIYPEDPGFVKQAYLDATNQGHGYLLIDCKQSTPDEFRFRTNIFPDDEYNYIYIPKYEQSEYMLSI